MNFIWIVVGLFCLLAGLLLLAASMGSSRQSQAEEERRQPPKSVPTLNAPAWREKYADAERKKWEREVRRGRD